MILKTFAPPFFLATLLFISCSHYDETQRNAKESVANEDSHHPGKNCMTCHQNSADEASEHWFYFAGTAYNKDGSVARTGGTVELWTGISEQAKSSGHLDQQSLNNGKKIYSIPVDASGNFYTAKIIDMKGGVYPRLVSNNNNDTVMNLVTNEGACNSCHGYNADGRNQGRIVFN